MLDDYLISIFVIIILLFFLTIALVFIITSGGSKTNVAINQQCPIGQCATNIVNGGKRCPPVGTDIPLEYTPGVEVCSPAFGCTDDLPFALQSDSSTNIFGICEPGVMCPCLNKFQCPSYIAASFTTNGGNPYAGGGIEGSAGAPGGTFSGQRINFPQFTSASGAPLNPSGPVGDNFCTIPAAWLPFSGCSFITSNQVTLDDITACMSGQTDPGPQQVTFSPCYQGVLAFLSSDSSNFTEDDIQTTQLGCVNGTGCGAGQVNVFDINTGSIVCKNF